MGVSLARLGGGIFSLVKNYAGYVNPIACVCILSMVYSGVE